MRDLPTNADDVSIVTALISLGNSLNMRVVAEGAETRAQLAFLQQQGCPEGQGYYFGQATAAEDFAFLRRRLSSPPDRDAA